MHDPLVRNLEGNLLDLLVRVQRLERKAGLDAQTMPLATFARGDQHAPSPDYSIGRPVERCSCDESVWLRARVRELESALTALGGQQ